jgi:hypothetical protein
MLDGADGPMRHVDVVIISWARTDELHQIIKRGLDTLFDSERNGVAFHAYVVESNPSVAYDEYNHVGWTHSCVTIHPDSSFGYHKYLNIGRKAGNSPYVVLCNSDLTYESNWASEIIKLMEIHPDVLSASPWCPQTLGDNKPHLGTFYRGHTVRQQVAGWCLFQQRRIYEILGDLDERYKFWYCDADYSLELQAHGIPHILVPSSVVNHPKNPRVGKTAETLSSAEQEALTFEQDSIFIEKWSAVFSSTSNERLLPLRRNQYCPCGSGKRIKHCHGALIPN